MEAFKEMINDERKPVNINLDEGSEFIYTPFKKYCDVEDIIL